MTDIHWNSPRRQSLGARAVSVSAALLVWISAGSAAATDANEKTDAERCAAVQNDQARLDCFDALYSRVTEEVLAAENPIATQAFPEAIPKATPETPADPLAEASDDPSKGSGAILERRARVNFSSKVKSLRAKDKQRMVFLLENGEVWMQSSPRNLPIKSGDDVTIKSGLMGGYILRTSNGVSSRVNRIK